MKTLLRISVPLSVLGTTFLLVFGTGMNDSAAAAKFVDTKMLALQSTAQDSLRGNDAVEVKTFTGTNTKSNGKFTLQESTVGATYILDDQKAARKYEGKKVLVTGTLDGKSKLIHVQKIEEPA